MPHRRVINLGTLVLASLFLIQCQNGRTGGAVPNTSGGLGSGGFNSFGGGGGGGLGGGGGTMPAPDYSAALNGLDDMADTPQEQNALNQAKDLNLDMVSLYSALRPGMTYAQVGSYMDDFQSLRQRASLVAQLLRQVGWNPIAEIFAEFSAKRDVHRFFHFGIGRHFWTLNPNEGGPHGYLYEGVGFRVYDRNKQDHAMRRQCTVAVFRCHKPYTGGHFVSVHSNCEGQTQEGQLGWICANVNYWANARLARLHRAGDHLITPSQQEVAFAQGLGYAFEGYLGVAPH